VDNKSEALENLLCAFGVFLVLLYGVLFEVILLQLFLVFLCLHCSTWRPKQSIFLGIDW
jgi:hypothetical protein